MAIEPETQDLAIGQTNASGALNMEKKYIYRIGCPCQRASCGAERARLNLMAGGIGYERPPLHPPHDRFAFKGRIERAETDARQITRPGINRHGERPCFLQRAGDLRLEIAGKQPLAAATADNLKRGEPSLDGRADGGVVFGPQPRKRAAGSVKRAGAEAANRAARFDLGGAFKPFGATQTQRRKNRRLLSCPPSGELVERHRRQRDFITGRWLNARSAGGNRRQKKCG